MPSLKVKLIKSSSGSSERQLATISGLGLTKFGQERIIQDTPANRGMVFRVKHLVSHEIVKEEAPKTKRRKPRKEVLRQKARTADSKG